MTNSQPDRATAFHAMHNPGSVLRLANAWDVASAVVTVAAGSPAVATTSAGVAWSAGAPDGDRLDRDRAVDLIARIVAAVTVPVTADIESGFGVDAAAVGETVRLVLAAGAVGINLEDSHQSDDSPLRPIAEQADRLAAARSAADSAGVDLFVNARIDTYFRLPEDARFAATVERAEAYLAAGASGIFVPGTADLATIARLAKEIPAPLNILVGPGSPSVAELTEAGVARISLGSAVAESAYAVMRRATAELLDTGTYDSVSGDSVTWSELNTLVASPPLRN